VALVTSSSRSPEWLPLQTLDRMLCSASISFIPSRVQMAENSRQSNTIFLLSEDLLLWSGLCDKVSGFSMNCLG